MSSSILTRTSLSFFHNSKFFPVAEKQNDMILGKVELTLSCDDTDFDEPFGLSGLAGFSGLSLPTDDRLKNCPSLEDLPNVEGPRFDWSSTCFS